MIKRAVSENGLVADLFYEEGRKSKPIIMLGGSEGGRIWSRIKPPVEYLVKGGYAVFSLAYFKEKGLPNSLEEIPLEYFEKAFSWLASQPETTADEVAILGGSKGAEAALLLGSRYPQIKVVVTFSPSSVIWQGIPRKRFDLVNNPKSSWSCNEEGLPFLPYPRPISTMQLLTLQLRGIHERALEDESRAESAAIPVENINGAVMLISGNRDALWPSTKMSEQIETRLKKRGFKHPFEHNSIDTNHYGLIRDRASWRRIFAFLQENY